MGEILWSEHLRSSEENQVNTLMCSTGDEAEEVLAQWSLKLSETKVRDGFQSFFEVKNNCFNMCKQEAKQTVAVCSLTVNTGRWSCRMIASGTGWWFGWQTHGSRPGPIC